MVLRWRVSHGFFFSSCLFEEQFTDVKKKTFIYLTLKMIVNCIWLQYAHVKRVFGWSQTKVQLVLEEILHKVWFYVQNLYLKWLKIKEYTGFFFSLTLYLDAFSNEFLSWMRTIGHVYVLETFVYFQKILLALIFV